MLILDLELRLSSLVLESWLAKSWSVEVEVVVLVMVRSRKEVRVSGRYLNLAVTLLWFVLSCNGPRMPE
jgi:hypothetical protein